GGREDLGVGEGARGAGAGGFGDGRGGDDAVSGPLEGGADDGADPSGGYDADREAAVRRPLRPRRGGAVLLHDADPVLLEVPVVAYGSIVLRRCGGASPGAPEWRFSRRLGSEDDPVHTLERRNGARAVRARR